jgi:TetR/AcrR family transcriptional regulator, regulator of cefoperazone and chloramphenicol sensitivity
MKGPRDDAGRTKQRLLAAASEVFAARSYRDATIAEICEQAGANIAAVNYHFGSKENLYVETWRYAFDESMRAHPPEGSTAPDAGPRERLRARIVALLKRISDTANREFSIVHQELANPTGLLAEVRHRELQPLHEKMEDLVRQLLAPGGTSRQAHFCTISIVSQCITPMLVRRLTEHDRQSGAAGAPFIDDVEAYAEHVVAFSLGGIEGISRGMAAEG